MIIKDALLKHFLDFEILSKRVHKPYFYSLRGRKEHQYSPLMDIRNRKTISREICLVVQWLRLHAFNAVGVGQSLVRELRSHMLHDMAGEKKKEYYQDLKNSLSPPFSSNHMPFPSTPHRVTTILNFLLVTHLLFFIVRMCVCVRAHTCVHV